MAKYLDYEGLKKFKENLDSVMGTGYEIASKETDIKTYIDSRIFVGSEDEINSAMSRGEIDETTFVVCTDIESKEIAPVNDVDIKNLFK